MPLNLDDVEETGSFLVPAYALEDGADPAYELDPQTLIGPIRGPDDIYARIRRDDMTFLPRGSTQFLFNASALRNPSVGSSDRPFSIRLQASPDEKPEGMRSTCLTVSGRRVCLRRTPAGYDATPVYAVWQTPVGDAATWVSRTTILGENGQGYVTKEVASQWSGRGVLCEIYPEKTLTCLLVEFRLFDGDPELPDLLRIWAIRHVLPLGTLPDRDPYGDPPSGNWLRLLGRAERGFREECLEQTLQLRNANDP